MLDNVVPPVCVSARDLPPSLDVLNPIVLEDLVRLGVNKDGGYLVPASAVAEADALLSFGLALDWSFERDALKLNPDLVIHAYDHSVGESMFLDDIVARWADARDNPVYAFSVMRYWVNLYQAYREFFQGNVTHFQERVRIRQERAQDVAPERILSRLEGRKNVMLKMDIEGAEYEVIDTLLTYHPRISLMTIEFHATDVFRELFLEKIDHIRRHYEVVHIHGNNFNGIARDGLPEVLEMTFLHRGRCTSSVRRDRLPIEGLDFPCDAGCADYSFVFSSGGGSPGFEVKSRT
jgi:hypothetical protein